MSRRAWLAAALVAAAACAGPGAEKPAETAAGPAVGPRTAPVETGDYAGVAHVAATGSDSAGDGSADHPWATIGKALASIHDAAEGSRQAVLVAEGTYAEPTIRMAPWVDLYGGFAADDWSRDVAAHPTVLDGEGKRRIALGADHAILDGFVLRGGVVRGHGGAILADGVSPTITNDVFEGNRTLAPEGWAPETWHETAHDGGAIACRNGCSAVIENDLFAGNETEIGRGAGVACDNEATREVPAAPRVSRNVFVGNTASAERFAADTMRSGDGGGVAFYGWCDGAIVGNVMEQNRADSSNDGGGVWVALWSAPEIADNVIVGNHSGDDGGGLFVGGQKHHYGTPKDPVPPRDEYFVRVVRNVIMGNESGTPTSGAFRATMMTRAAFYDNVTAQNPGGVYTQRSEVDLVHNTFTGDARNEDEHGEAPGPTVYRNNLILGARNWNAPVTDEGNDCAEPGFVDDGFAVDASAATYDAARHVTRVDGALKGIEPGALAGRVVKAGARWAVVRWNDAGTLEVWGDVSGAGPLEVQPTYHLSDDSPCVDRGMPVDAPEKDMDGDPRTIGAAPDPGADEVRETTR